MTEDFSGKIGFRDTVYRFLKETKITYLYSVGAEPMTAYQFLGFLREEVQNKIKKLDEMDYTTVTNPNHALFIRRKNLMSLQSNLTDLRDQCLEIVGSGLARQNPPNRIIEEIVGKPHSLSVRDFKSLFESVVNQSHEYLVTGGTPSDMRYRKDLGERLKVFCESYQDMFSPLFDEHGVALQEGDLISLSSDGKAHVR